MMNTERGGNATTRILKEGLILFGSTSTSALHRARWELKIESQVLQWMRDAAAMTLAPISL